MGRKKKVQEEEVKVYRAEELTGVLDDLEIKDPEPDYTENIDQNNLLIKKRTTEAIKMYYDIQKLRIAVGNRIVASFNLQLGQEPGMKQSDLEEDSQKMISKLRKEYRLITDAYIEEKKSIKKMIQTMIFTNDLVFIKNTLDYDLIDQYEMLYQTEKKTEKTIKGLITQHPLWEKFFLGVKGCGPVMAAACISYFDIYSTRYPAGFIAYAGLNPVPYEDEDGNIYHKANSKSYTVMRDYVDKEGNTKQKKSITYNPQLKSILLGVLANCIIKANVRTDKETGMVTVTGPYANAYMDYKIRQRSKHTDYTAMHINRMALNYMMRQFIKDLWKAWRDVEGLPIPPSYEEKFLGMKPHHWPTFGEYNKEDK